MKAVLLGLVLLFSPVSGFASLSPLPGERPGWLQDGLLAGDRENVRSREGFGAQLWIINDKTFFENWDKPQTPHVPVARAAARNQPLYVIFFFADPGVDQDLNADVVADVTITGPDGKVYGEFKNMDLWHGPYEVPVGNIQLALSHIVLVVEDADQLGAYTVTASVVDRIRNIRVDLTTRVVAEGPRGKD